MQKAHSILNSSLLTKSQQGLISTTPMFVINSDDLLLCIDDTLGIR